MRSANTRRGPTARSGSGCSRPRAAWSTARRLSDIVKSLNRLMIAAVLLFPVSPALAAEPAAPWPAVTLAPAREVTLSGPLGEALQRGVARLAKPPVYGAVAAGRRLVRAQPDLHQLQRRRLRPVPRTGQFDQPAGPALAADPGPAAEDGRAFSEAGRPFRRGGGSQPSRCRRTAPPIPMLWGNARLLVGLVTAARQFHDEELLASARRLGDFYVNTADQLCSPAREADYRSSGTYGDGYTCCYFPAIEGLAMLYQRDQGRPLSEAGGADGRVLHEVRLPAGRAQPRQPLRVARHPGPLRDHRQPHLPGAGQGQVGRRHEGRFRLAAGRRRRALARLLPRRRGVQRVGLAAVQPGPLAVHRPDPLPRRRRAAAGEPVRDEPVPQRRLRHGPPRRRRGRARRRHREDRRMALLLQFPWAAGTALPQGLPGRRQRARRHRQFPL